MGLLDQLWDDTVAGPAPETGLGKLRKHSTFSFRSNSGSKEVEPVARSNSEDLSDEVHRNVTRSIMILKPRPGNLMINGNDGGGSSSAPASPAGSTPPVSPFTPSGSPFSGGRESNRFRRRLSSSDVYERGAASSAPTAVPIRAAATTTTAMGDGSRGSPPTYNV